MLFPISSSRGDCTSDTHAITRLLHDWSSGNAAPLDALTPHVYRELHALAQANLNRNRPDQILQPTALINEAYLRLIDQSQPVRWENRSHFFGIAAHLMRTILVDHTRAQHAAKRGGGAVAVTLDDRLAAVSSSRAPDLLEIDEALNRLAEIDDRKSRIVEMHYFGGMTREEIAGALNLSVATVKRDLSFGLAWLRLHLSGKG